MKSQILRIQKMKEGMRRDQYVAAFADGTVSYPLSPNTTPNPSEGPFARIYADDSKQGIIAKLGAL